MTLAPPFMFVLARSAPVSLAQSSVGLTVYGYDGSEAAIPGWRANAY